MKRGNKTKKAGAPHKSARSRGMRTGASKKIAAQQSKKPSSSSKILPASLKYPSHEERRAAAVCYSPIGQTRLVWSAIGKKEADSEFVRFHFFQASMLMFAFIFAYAIAFAYAAWAQFVTIEDESDIWTAALILFAILSMQALIFSYLGAGAINGMMRQFPVLGAHSQKLAKYGKPLERLRL